MSGRVRPCPVDLASQLIGAAEMFEVKRHVVFDHLLASFFDDGGSVYSPPQ